VITVASHTKKDNPAGLPSKPSSPSTAPGAPYVLTRNAAGHCAPGGELVFLVNAVQVILTWPEQDDLPATETLQRPYFGMHRFQWQGSDAVEFHLGHGDMIRLLSHCGLEIADLIEIQPPPGSTTRHPIATLDWARQ
jgi:hypothetical protein